MTFAVTINEKKTVLLDISVKNKKVIFIGTTISTNYSLIKYILSLTKDCGITENKDGYICIKREDGSVTSLQRVILEFYSRYDDKLKEVLNNKNIDVDHIDNNKLNNTINNFQMLTHRDNVLKSKNSKYEVIIKNKYVIQLDNKIRELEQYKKDEKNLKISSSKFNKFFKSDDDIETNMNNISYLYLCSSYNEMINCSYLCYRDYKDYISYISEKCRRKLIFLYNYRNYCYVYRTFTNNLKLLNYFRNRYENINLILSRFQILDKNKDLNFNNVKYNYDDVMKKFYSKNVLYDLYELILYENKYKIKDNNILSSIDISIDLDKIGKYNCIRIMYLLGLLKREKSAGKKTFMSIPVYTEEQMKEINKKAKRILELKWRKVRFFMVMEEFGEDVAKQIYKERFTTLKRIYLNYSLRAKNDIINLLKNDEQIKKLGFITIEEIYDEIQYINEKRKNNNEAYNDISENFIIFIKDLLKYNPDTKKLMKEMGVEYVTINKNIIKNIEKFQISNELETKLLCNLKSKNMAIVLKKLI